MGELDLAPLLQALATSLSLFAMGWWPCGACIGQACSYCSGNSAPAELEVEIDGLADRDCYDCQQLNGVYVLTFLGEGPAGCCWRFQFEETCGFDVLVACISNPIALGYQLEVSLGLEGAASDVIVWIAPEGNYPPDCDAWENVEVQVTDQVQTQCYDDSATCTVTAV